MKHPRKITMEYQQDTFFCPWTNFENLRYFEKA